MVSNSEQKTISGWLNIDKPAGLSSSACPDEISTLVVAALQHYVRAIGEAGPGAHLGAAATQGEEEREQRSQKER